jgi:ribosomal protein S18 acetylase RimI-like enzyme
MEGNISVNIKSIRVKEHYELVEKMMRGLHDSEKELFNKAEQWDNIRESYMRHVISCQEENEGAFLVAYIDNKPAGFIFGYIEEQDDSRIEVYIGDELYVSDGYVDPQYRKIGIYRKLNAALEDIYIAKGVRRITRFTLTSNTRMQKLLESEGYSATRIIYEKWLEPDGDHIQQLGLEPPKE